MRERERERERETEGGREFNMYYKKDGETFYPEYYFQVKNQKAKSIFFYNM